MRHNLLLSGALVILAQTAAAQPEQHWVFVPVFVGSASAPIPQLVDAFERAIGQQRAVISNAQASQHVENKHSSEPVQVTPEQLERWMAVVGKGRESLAMGNRREGQKTMRPIDELEPDLRDYLKRSPERAQMLFNACTLTAHLLLREKRRAEAESQMLRCVRAFPGLRPAGKIQPETLQLFEDALEQLALEPHGELELRGGAESCSVRSHGLVLGTMPLQLRLPLGIFRFQVECTDAPGRIHAALVQPGTNRVVVDPRFDAVLHTAGALWLEYPSAQERDAKMDQDAATLGQVLGSSNVVLLVVDATSREASVVRVRAPELGAEADIGAAHFSAREGYTPSGVQAAVRVLEDRVPNVPTASLQSSDREGREEGSGAAGEELEAVRVLEESEPQGPAHAPSQMAVGFAVGAAILAVGTLSVSWALYAKRYSIREETYYGQVSYEARQDFATLGDWVLGLSLTAGALGVAAEQVLLPHDPDGVPTMAWVLGAAGMGVAITGLVFGVASTHCEPRVFGAAPDGWQECGFVEDAVFGPLLAAHALPLLAVPVTYLLRQAFRSDDFTLSLTDHGISVAGVF